MIRRQCWVWDESKKMFGFKWKTPLAVMCMGAALSGCSSVPFLSQASLFDGDLRISPPPGYCQVQGPVSQSSTHAMVAYTPCFRKGSEIITVTTTKVRDTTTVKPTQLGQSVNGLVARSTHTGAPRPFEDAKYMYRIWSQSSGYGMITTYYGPDDSAKDARSALLSFHRNLQNAAVGQ